MILFTDEKKIIIEAISLKYNYSMVSNCHTLR